MVSRILFSILLLLSPLASGQTLTPLEFSGPIRPDYVAPGAGDKFVRAGDLDGAYVKTATFASNVLTLTTQLANNSSATVTVPITSTPAANSITAAQARASTAAFQREWKTRLAIPDDWSEIASGTAIGLGKVVEHSGAYFGAITSHSKGSTGPDGDPTNWILLSNWRGDWSAAWYPAGTLVRRGGLPWVATAVVSVSDPAPDAATNTKWLRLGSAAPAVVSGAINANIPASANGHTYILTGSTARTFFLPNASGTGEVPNAWEVVLGNRSSAALSVSPNGSDVINGNAALTVAAGQAVKLQKFSTSNWIVIADTTRGESTGTPTASIADNSITPAKAQAGTTAQKKAWRDRFASSSIGLVASALPAVADHNTGDTLVIGRGGATTVPFREIDAPATEITTTAAGDIVMLLAAGWTRVGNLFSGGIAAAAAQTVANALRDRLVVSLTQGDFYGGSAANIQGTYHINVQSMPGAFPTANVVQVWIGDPGIARVLSQTWAPGETQRTLEFEIDAAAADNLVTNNLVTVGNDLGIEIRLIAPGAVELYRGGFDFPIIARPTTTGLTQPQVDARIQSLRALVPTIATPASGDRFFFTDENQSGDPLRYTQGATLINRNFTAKTATAGAARTWTYTLATEDTEILIGATVSTGGGNNRTGFATRLILRAMLSSTALVIDIDHRNPGGNQSPHPDDQSIGVTASISGNTLTLTTTGWANSTAPVVYSK